MLVISTFSMAKTSREMPEVKDSERTVESYALVYTLCRQGVNVNWTGKLFGRLTLCASIGSNLMHEMDDWAVAGQ
jgi:hypothetical protein